MFGAWPAPGQLWSRELRELRSSLVALDGWFLTWAIGRQVPTAQNDYEIAQVEAFEVLAHARVERYLEDRVIDTVDALRALSLTAADISAVAALACLVWTLPQAGVPRRKLQPGDHAILDMSFNALTKIVNENNGIKKTNLGRMIEGFGLTVSQLGTLLAGELDSAGRSRGNVAHGATIGAAVAANASDAVNRYVHIVQELPKLERLLFSVV